MFSKTLSQEQSPQVKNIEKGTETIPVPGFNKAYTSPLLASLKPKRDLLTLK